MDIMCSITSIGTIQEATEYIQRKILLEISV
jgi:hypothetical protein